MTPPQIGGTSPLQFVSEPGPLAYPTPSEENPSQNACFEMNASLLPNREPGRELSQSYSIQLFAPMCASSDHFASVAINTHVSVSLPLTNFDTQDATQRAVAHTLSEFFSDLDLDSINQEFLRGEYAAGTIYDLPLTLVDVESALNGLGEINSQQKLAIGFFMYGQELSIAQMEELFSNKPNLWQVMQNLNLIVADPVNNEPHFRMNDLTLVSHRLPNEEVLYLFADLPTRLQKVGDHYPTAQISGTSYIFMRHLEISFMKGEMDQPTGVLADFGSGTGILTLAMLKLYPSIDEALAVEIDPGLDV